MLIKRQARVEPWNPPFKTWILITVYEHFVHFIRGKKNYQVQFPEKSKKTLISNDAPADPSALEK